MINNISIVTYTNSICHDVLRVHLGQIDKFASNIKSYVFTNAQPDFECPNHEIVIYNNDDPYYKHWEDCMDNVKEEFIIYLQEDFFLYATVDYDEIERCSKFLLESDFSFVRFSKFNLQIALHRSGYAMKKFPEKIVSDLIYDAHTSDVDSFSFMMQATLWKKSDFLSLYRHVESKKWLESEEWDLGVRFLNILGAYYYNGEKKIGKFHWESSIWPHVCTAVGKGKWSISHHDHVLSDMLLEYDIDTSIRGTR